MPHYRQHIVDFAEICFRKGIETVVVSPGSRNAPLIDAFYHRFGDKCISIVDERSAAFFALGVANYSNKPVVLICSSGSAALNFAPALAEAYYQKVPLIAVTADRPVAWIGQQDNQTIRQRDVYDNYIRKSCELPCQINNDDDLWHAHREINDAINSCRGFCGTGPVHINVPLSEPLYEPLPPVSKKVRIIDSAGPQHATVLTNELRAQWQKAQKILIIHGQDSPQSGVAESLKRLSKDSRVTIIAENIANVRDEKIIANPELMLAHCGQVVLTCPDLLVYSGGQIVSKKLKTYLRALDIQNCWRIGLDDGIIDTFQHAATVLPLSPNDCYSALCALPQKNDTDCYNEPWIGALKNGIAFRDITAKNCLFSDFAAVSFLQKNLPHESVLALGNSSIIRYSQLCDRGAEAVCFSNRGVSGIDGSVSTAAGLAFASGALTVCLVGDLSFVYDSNGLWNRVLPANLRIAVINNKGGGIFDLIGAPLQQLPYKNYMVASHPVDLKKLSEAFGVRYFFAESEKDLQDAIPKFFAKSDTAAVLEIATVPQINTAVFKKIMGMPER